MMKPSRFLPGLPGLVSFLLILSAPVLSQGNGAVGQLNVLWIIGEDLGPELGCMGVPEVRTPNLDRLAGDGVLFSRAFSATPVCSTSRSGFMTGMYPIAIGAHNHRSHRDDGFGLPDGVKVLTDHLRAAGYHTSNLRNLTGDGNEKFLRGSGKTDWNFRYKGRPFDGARWDQLPKDRPFHAQVNFAETHRGGAWNQSHRHIERRADPAKVQLPPYYPDHPEVRRDWAQYLNTVMALDKKVGAVLEMLERDGLADRTVVVFFGDHGRAMVRGKQWPYDSGLRVPLIVRWPKGIDPPQGFNPGTVDDGPVSLLDVTASTLDWCGVKKPEGMHGRVLFGAHADPRRKYVFGSRDRCDETVFRIRTVRDVRYRYIRNFMPWRPFLQLNRYKERSYPMIPVMRRLFLEGSLDEVQARIFQPRRPAEELYDLDRDPWETVNLVESDEHGEILSRLRGALEGWLQSTGDKGAVLEADEIVEAWERRAEKNNGQRLKKQADAARGPVLYDESKIPHYVLPDPLVTNSGKVVSSAEEWRKVRRPEVLELFRRHMYGRIPPVELKPVFRVRSVEEGALGGKAVRKQVRISFSSAEDAPFMDLLLYLPLGGEKPVPAFLGLNFCGNQAVSDDPGIELASGWVANVNRPGTPRNHRADDRSRGARKSRWPVEEILARGYALATVCYGDIDPDFDDGFKNGVHPLFMGERTQRRGDDAGTIAAWAWGLSRALDYLEEDSGVDGSHVAVVGHSRLGKTALWAGARDPRFALVVSNDSGCGGAALFRRAFGETLERMNRVIPHWLCRNARHFNDREYALPLDQHMLVSLVAPRPVLICSAEKDRWADPRGEFLAAVGADPVYELLGEKGVGRSEYPENGNLVGDRVGYHVRSGGHDMTLEDWKVYMSFADRHWPGVARK